MTTIAASRRGINPPHATALELHNKLLRISNAIDSHNLPANVKTAMALQAAGL